MKTLATIAGTVCKLAVLILTASLLVSLEEVRAEEWCGRLCSYDFWESASEADLRAELGRVDLAARDKDGNTPLHWVANFGDASNVALLLDRGADIEVRGEGGMTPLHSAVLWAENASVTALLLDRGADIAARNIAARNDVSGNTPLHYAQRAATPMLLDRGADIEARNDEGRTPLHQAARFGAAWKVELLLDRGADIAAWDKDGRTPLEVALSYAGESVAALLRSRSGIEVPAGECGLLCYPSFWPSASEADVRTELDRGADIAAQGEGGMTPLYYALVDSKFGRGNPKFLDALAALMGEGADPNVEFSSTGDPDSPKVTAYEFARRKNRIDVYWVLYGCGPTGGENFADTNDVNARDANGFMPLHYAAFYRSPSDVVMLLDRGADIEARGKCGWTPLHAAAAGNTDPAVVELLLDRGAKADVKEINDHTPFDLAKSNKAIGSAIHWRLKEAQSAVRVESVQAERCGRLCEKTFWEEADKADVRAELSRGANIETQDGNGQTPLHWAAAYGDASVVALLLRRGASTGAEDHDGYTPLHYAAGGNNGASVVRLLLRQGADIEAWNDEGHTPLHLAAGRGDASVVSLLLEQGANPGALDNDGKTPFDLIEENDDLKNTRAYQLLKKAQQEDGEQ